MPNPSRRRALLDAAVEVLAGSGARGLTFRGIDDVADVPTGTTSNYFASREVLLAEVAERVLERLRPDVDALATTMAGPPSRDLDLELMRQLVGRVTADRSAWLALLELRLEATRRPELRADLTRTLGGDLEANIAFHLDAGLPGDANTVLVLYLAMTGLILDHLTLPDLAGDRSLDDVVEHIVTTIVPDGR